MGGSNILRIWIKITEGDGSRWTIYKTIDVNLVPREVDSGEADCEANPDAEGCDSTTSGDSSSGGMGTLLLGGIAAFVLLLVIIVTLLLVRGRGSGSTEGGDAGWTGADVAEMDPVEAYVQQLVAQGYPEETARAYAQQYYAQAAQQQQQQ